MRTMFVRTLVELAEQDPRVMFLTGDLGFAAVEPFADRFPDRFVNVGVAEQNMVGLATGLAEAGFIPFVYSIAPFASLRAYEFLRNGPILHQLPVRVVGVGGGFEYGPAGPTHYGVEDVGVMRIQPGLTVIAPADPLQMRSALLKTWSLPSPVYYRIGKDDRRVLPGLDGEFDLGRAQRVRDGQDLLVITTGSVSTNAAVAVTELADRGVSCALLVVASLVPPPLADLAEEIARFPRVLTVEAHYVTGGLGSLVAEVIAERGLCSRLTRCGVTRLLDGPTGGEEYLHEQHGLSPRQLVATALSALGRAS